MPFSALERGRASVPTPWQAKSGKGLAQHRLLKGGLSPALAAVRGHHDLLDPAGSGVRKPVNLVEARLLQYMAVRREGDEGYHLLQKIKSIGFAVRQDRRVGLRLVHAESRLLDQLEAAQELDVHVAFVTRQQQAHGIAVAGH